jgi:RND superfamily putative drug exporter
VLLALAFRSVLVPLKAVIANLLSVGAGFGVLTCAFDHHWSATAIGLQRSIPIASFVPLMMFAILFGLSMDYEVFLMTRIRERWSATGHAHQAVTEGLSRSARVITSAALIMVSVFCAFVINSDPNVKQFGLGLAVAVAVDVSVVRCLVVPAAMSLLGAAAWWLPRWLAVRIPNLSVEGERWFQRHDTKAAIGTPASSLERAA